MKPVILRHVIYGQPFTKVGDRRISKNGWLWECTRVEAVLQTHGPIAGWWMWEAEFTPVFSPEDFQLACEIAMNGLPKVIEQCAATVAAGLKALSGEAA